MAQEGPTQVEITKARNQALVGFWRGLETISGKAQALGTYQVFHGDYRKLFDAPTVYEGITAEDVRQAAVTVLRADNRTVGVLVPKVADATAPTGGAKAWSWARMITWSSRSPSPNCWPGCAACCAAAPAPAWTPP